ncbi:MAG: hypothetical protein J4N76_09955 [Chloroflexi bacterium]|nr:hypothetical protein [Chloroflexota bacterium]MCI0828298.1 hypothetical protein [Chloroflexota bacterium]MCI0862027.1 hypothetical protein [Chloroflexota bacterium]MCI0876866.1 hypothetical protein [Chloroflexota bacterium]MCI0892990.1 hypothetical protein [Chloroflexota bacterium]
MSGTSHILDPEKIDSDALKLNLMISSLYLFTFELLRLSMVGGVKGHFLLQGEYSPDEINELKELDSKMKDLGEDLGESAFEVYQSQLDRFNEAVGMEYDTPDNHLLLPCANWLRANNVVSADDVATVGRIRDHRNQIAHEMPSFLFESGHDVDVDLLTQTREILRKVDLFWFRMDIHFDPTTLEEIDTSEIPDEEVFSGRDAFLALASSAVSEYAKQVFPGSGDPVH